MADWNESAKDMEKGFQKSKPDNFSYWNNLKSGLGIGENAQADALKRRKQAMEADSAQASE